MKKEKIRFIKTGIIFVLIFIALFMIINFVYIKFFLSKNLQARAEAELQNFIKEKAQMDYLVLGDSHAHQAVNPEYLPNSFNLAHSSNTYAENYYKLRRLLYDQKIKVKYLLLEVDMHSFSSYMKGPMPLKREFWYYASFVPVKDIRNISGASEFDIRINHLFPVLGRGEDMLALLFSKPSKQVLGWASYDTNISQQNITKLTVQRVEGQFLGQERIDPLLIEYYVKILKMAREKNITVILVKYPVLKQYDEVLNEMNVTKEDYYDYIYALASEHVGKYYVLDYYDLFFNQSKYEFTTSDYFSDPDHVNALGANILSEKVSNDLKEKGLE
ncbi:DUF1574 family protein [Candidatus Woesearchaeota archaeon]|nr:DUF1574 family protein [Candidatus Woesearchaeota archaeon]